MFIRCDAAILHGGPKYDTYSIHHVSATVQDKMKQFLPKCSQTS